MKIFLPVILFSLLFQTKAQNFVPNPDFESVRNLPDKNNNSISCTKNWLPANGAGDYYHRKGDRHAGTPKNIFGRQKPHSGDAYGGICIRKNFKEYIEIKLIDTLKEGQEYLVELYISRAERSIGSVKEFGVLFAKKARWAFGDLGLSEVPGVEFKKGGRYRKKKGWMKLTGTYKAEGNEIFIVLGHFTHDKSPRFRGVAHYYIDDVSVTPISQKEESVTETPAQEPVVEVPATEKVMPDILSPKIGETLTLKNIFFETAKSDLLAPSFPELDILVQILSDDLSTQIEISGHTDNTGNEKLNLLLSKARAKAISDYLITKGIDKGRISYTGFGSDNPITTNDSEEGRKQNRRVEFILKKISD